MSKQYNCQACNELSEKNPEFLELGVTDAACTSLKNDTGFKPSNNHNDCTDLNHANDCLIGNMDEELKLHGVCDWKKFMRRLIPNMHQTLKAMICAVCGMWTNVHSLQAEVDRLKCLVSALFDGMAVTFKENDFIEGTGVDFDRPDAGAVDLSCMIKGNLARFHGSISVDMTNSHWKGLGLYNTSVGTHGLINMGNGGYTVAILKFKKNTFPQIKKIYSDQGQLSDDGCASIRVCGHDEGEKYPGQWGAVESGWSTVPAGYYYVRICMESLITWGRTGLPANEAKVTFDCLNMVELNEEKIVC